jgi:hypothetical protein
MLLISSLADICRLTFYLLSAKILKIIAVPEENRLKNEKRL